MAGRGEVCPVELAGPDREHAEVSMLALQSTRSAREAASALGCETAQIAKSLVFRGVDHDEPVLVLAAGPDRVDEAALARLLGFAIEQASATWVKQRTGFAVGGVPPVGHSERLTTVMDANLLRHGVVWAAAGTPRAVFAASPEVLRDAADGQVVSITG